jgi:hypothetical protein
LALCVAAALPFRLRVEPQYYAQRDDEEAVGREVSKRLPHEVVILATTDFGYFAIQAAARHPSRFVVADRHDPREASSAEPLPLRVLALARSSAACFAVVPLCVELPEVTTLAETSDYRIVRFANEKCVDP